MAITIRDVAEKAGVSKAAVSYVLNGRETAVRIAPETRERIRAVARELDYRPSAVARALTRKRTDTVTLVMQYATIFAGWSGFTSELMRGAVDAAVALGFDLMLHTKDQSDIDHEVAALTDGRADGALLLRDRDDGLAAELTRRGFPCVFFFGQSAYPDVRCVDCDNRAGARLAVEHLAGLGHRRIAHLGGTSRSSAAAERKEGFREAVHRLGIERESPITVEVADPARDLSLIDSLLGSAERPSAVFAWSDDIALLVLKRARERGIRVPEDLSVVGFDSTGLCEHTNPPLTSVRQPVYEIAAEAFRMLAGQIRADSAPVGRLRLQPSLDIRGSTAPPSAGLYGRRGGETNEKGG
jgi:LacI family transcriptional regulator